MMLRHLYSLRIQEYPLNTFNIDTPTANASKFSGANFFLICIHFRPLAIEKTRGHVPAGTFCKWELFATGYQRNLIVSSACWIVSTSCTSMPLIALRGRLALGTIANMSGVGPAQPFDVIGTILKICRHYCVKDSVLLQLLNFPWYQSLASVL